MLVLSRIVGEKVEIGRDIVVTVLKSEGDKVRLGFEAPRHVSIMRSEVASAGAGRVRRSDRSHSA